MKQYNTPKMEVVILVEEDILTLSKIEGDGQSLTLDF